MRITVLFFVFQLPKGFISNVIGFKNGVETEAIDTTYFEGDVSAYFACKTDWFLARGAICDGGFEDGPSICSQWYYTRSWRRFLEIPSKPLRKALRLLRMMGNHIFSRSKRHWFLLFRSGHRIGFLVLLCFYAR